MQGTEALDITDHTVSPHLVDMTRAAVAQVFDVELGDMHTRSRYPRAALARQIAMYLGHVVLRMTVTQIATAFDRERSTVFHAVRHVEDLRDDPELDRTVLYLESLVRNAVGEGA
jgi:chromosomal replication initiation ATPase DnaA